METIANARYLPHEQTVQRLTEADRPALLQHLQNLSQEDRCRRFGIQVTPAYLGLYVASVQFGRDVIFGSCYNGQLIAVCQLALYPGDLHKLAEVGLSIAEPFRRQGHATRMLTICIADAIEQGIEALEINYVCENTAMAKLCANFGASRKSENGSVCATLQLERQTTVGHDSIHTTTSSLYPGDRGRLNAARQPATPSQTSLCFLLSSPRTEREYQYY